MTREQFEYAIRAAGAVLGVAELLIIDRQALHGSLTENLPVEALRSGLLFRVIVARIRATARHLESQNTHAHHHSRSST